MARGISTISTTVGGIDEMYTHEVEGYLVKLFDTDSAVRHLTDLYENPTLRARMSNAAKAHFAETFDLDNMVEKYRTLLSNVAKPTILIDLDGALVDWDAGFSKEWKDRSQIHRENSYYMEECVDENFANEVKEIYLSKGFFENLPPMEGGLEAVTEMAQYGLQVILCTAPVLTSQNCAQEKLNWISNHLGQDWLTKTILCTDKVNGCNIDLKINRFDCTFDRQILKEIYSSMISQCSI